MSSIHRSARRRSIVAARPIVQLAELDHAARRKLGTRGLTLVALTLGNRSAGYSCDSSACVLPDCQVSLPLVYSRALARSKPGSRVHRLQGLQLTLILLAVRLHVPSRWTGSQGCSPIRQYVLPAEADPVRAKGGADTSFDLYFLAFTSDDAMQSYSELAGWLSKELSLILPQHGQPSRC